MSSETDDVIKGSDSPWMMCCWTRAPERETVTVPPSGKVRSSDDVTLSTEPAHPHG